MLKLRLLGVLFWIGAVNTFAFGAETKEIRLDAAGLERDARLVGTLLDRRHNVITLDDSELIEDDAPGSGVPEGMDVKERAWVEHLRKGIVIKKILMLDDASAFSGRLVFEGTEKKGNTEPLHISLNGVEFTRPASSYAFPYSRQYTEYTPYDCWYFVDIPSGALRRGENEILMWAESDSTSWYVFIAVDSEFARGSVTRTHHPNRSFKSGDSGRTWSDSRLGWCDKVDGEYSVRLSLDRYVRSGEYISPVMDIIGGTCPLKMNAVIRKVDVAIDIETPNSTEALVMTRFGSSPRTDDPSWTPWTATGTVDEKTDPGNRRYFQWKAELSSGNRLRSPKIKGLSLSAEWEDRSPNKKLGIAVEVIHNGHVARSSYPFTYENYLHPGLEKYRKDAKLDKIVEGASGEFEIMMRLLNWAYHIPVTNNAYSWNWNEVVHLEKGEKGMPRLQTDYEGRRRDAMCLYSNQALIGAMLAMGYQARHININSETEAGHEVTEVWSNEFNKWIYMDATRDYYYFDAETGIPLDLLEIHDRWAAELHRTVSWDKPLIPENADEIAARVSIGIREGNNPVSIITDGRHLLEITGYFRIIPRNDFLSNPLPVPVHTGASAWGWNGFLNYYDDTFPRRYEHQLQSGRALDFYEPLDQAEVHLLETAEPGVLMVDVNTFTPGFDTFMVRANEGKWVEQREPSWLWALKPGNNRLDVRVRNVRGVFGPISSLMVTCNP
ncbi:hypothetical protein LLG96_09365 [bacterium]|nr:hypothetical protein [bacterium]